MSNPSLTVRIAANLSELRKNLAEGKGQIETTTAAMQKLATSFSGDRIVQAAHNVTAAVNQIGGASKLTEAEQARVNRTVEAALQKYAAMGREAPAALRTLADETKKVEQPSGILAGTVGRLASAFAIGAIVDRGVSALASFARESFAAAGAIKDTGDKLGWSAEAVQRLQFVADNTGASLEKFTGAAFKLSTNLAGGSTSTREALQATGVAFADLQSLRPEDQFVRIADALGQMTDPQERNRAGMALFGRTFAEMAPAVVDGYSRMAAAATVSSDAQITALDEASKAVDRMTSRVGTLVTSGMGELFITLEQVGGALKAAFTGPAAKQAEAGIAAITAAAQTTAPAMADYTSRILDAHVAVNDLDASQRQQIDAALRLGVSTQELGDAFGLSSDAMRIYAERVREAEASERSAASASRAYSAAVKNVGLITGETSVIVKFQIAGVIGPALTEFATKTNSVEQAMQDLRDELFRVQGAATQIAPVLSNSMNLPFAQFPASVQASGTASSGFFSNFKAALGDAGMNAQSLSGLFAQAFTGGGGALGAMKAFATQGMSALLGMVPGVGPFLQQFAGPIIAGFGKIAEKARDMLRGVFGGPNRDELNGRNIVREFEGNLAGLLTGQQRIDAGGESWRETVIAITAAYQANGLTAEQAARDAERLWASSREGAEASRAVIAQIEANMRRNGDAAVDAVDRVSAALDGLPDVIDIDIRGNYRPPTVPGEGGYATGTMGRHGTFFRDFGAGTPTVLHGKEAVITPAQAPAFARAVLGQGGGDPDLLAAIRSLPRDLKIAMREAMAMA